MPLRPRASRIAGSCMVGVLLCIASVSCTGGSQRASVDLVWARYETVDDVAASSTIAVEVLLKGSPTYVPFKDESGTKPWGYSRYSARVSHVLGSAEDEVSLAEGDEIFVETDGASDRLLKDDPEFAAALAERSQFEVVEEPFVVFATLKTDDMGNVVTAGDVPILYVTGNRFGILAPAQGTAPGSMFVWLALGVATPPRFSAKSLQKVSDVALGTRTPKRPGAADPSPGPTVPDVPPEGRPPVNIHPSGG